MKTSAIEVHDMLSVFSVDEVERRIGEVPGVQSVTVNFAAGNATVRYDETQLEATDIKSAVRQRGFDPAAGPAGDGDEGKAASGTPPTAAPASLPAGEAPAPPDAPTSTSTAAAGAPAPDKAAAPAAAEPAPAEPPTAPEAAASDESKDKAAPEMS